MASPGFPEASAALAFPTTEVVCFRMPEDCGRGEPKIPPAAYSNTQQTKSSFCVRPKVERLTCTMNLYQLPAASGWASQFSISFTIPSSLIFTSLRPFSAEASLTRPE